MKPGLILLALLVLALPALAQRPSGAGILVGVFMSRVGPEDRQIADSAPTFLEATVRRKTYRYPAIRSVTAPGHVFRHECKIKNLPTDVLLTNLKLVIVEAGKELVLLPTRFDGRALLLSSSKITVIVDGKKYHASKPLREIDAERQPKCPTGLKMVSGVYFDSKEL